MSVEESMKIVNPDYPCPGATMNCTFCTTAMTLREKGYDVKAAKLDDGMYSDELYKKMFNAPTIKLKGKQTPERILSELSKNGEGSYGNLSVMWELGGGHSLFWKVENGKTRIYDGQNGQEYTESTASWIKYTRDLSMKDIKYHRFDDKQPTEYALAGVKINNNKQ